MTLCGAKLACGKFDWVSTCICWFFCPCFTIPCVFYKLTKHGMANRKTWNMIESLCVGDIVNTNDEDYGKRVWVVMYREKTHTILYNEESVCVLDIPDYEAHSRFVVDWNAKKHGQIRQDEYQDMQSRIASNKKLKLIELLSEWCNAPCVDRVHYTNRKYSIDCQTLNLILDSHIEKT